MRVIAAACVFGLAFALAPALAADLTGHPSVIDGDTIEIHGTRIRLFGIDAPESRQLCKDAAGQDYRCGQKAAFALADHVGGGVVSCDPRDTDRYGRTVAVCFLGSEDLNAWMVAQGWAVAYRHYSTDYVPQEEAAHAAKLGIWAGSFMMPWDWRAADRKKSTGWNEYGTIPMLVSCIARPIRAIGDRALLAMDKIC